MTNHGGKREGAGRKPARGARGKLERFYLYEGEKEKIKEFIKKLREP